MLFRRNILVNRSFRVAAGAVLALLLLGGIAGGLYLRGRHPAEDATALAQRPEKQILVFLSAHATNSRTAKWLDVIESWAQRNRDFRISLNIIELDVLRNPDEGDWRREIFKELPAIRERRYDLILTLDNVPLDLLVRPENRLPPEVPILFSGYEKDPAALRKQHPNMTGIRGNLSLLPNLELGMKLLPETREIIILTDASADSRVLLADVRKHHRAPEDVPITVLSNQDRSVHDICQILAKKTERSLLVLPPWRQMARSDYQTRNAMAQDLSSGLRFPFLVSTDEVLGSGALGGYLVPVADLAAQTAALAGETLRKGAAAGIPVRTFDNQYRFDDTMLRKFGIPEDRLPPGSAVVNRPPDAWRKYRAEILIGAGLLAGIIGALAGYVLVVRRTLKRCRRLYSALPGNIEILNEKEEILYRSSANGGEARVLRDLPDIDYPKLSATIREVFRTGENRMLDYEYKSVNRMMSVAPIPTDLFGEKAVVCFSHDNAELQQARRQAEEYAVKLKRTMRMWDILINAQPIHIFAKDTDHDFRYVFNNRTRAEFYGLPVEELNGKNDFDLLSPEQAERARAADEKALQDPSADETDFTEICDASGTPHILKTIRVPFVDDDGTRLLLGTAFDTTELMASKRRAEENAEWLQLMIQSIGDGVITTDEQGRIVLLNPVAERMTGVKQQEAIGRPHEEVFKIVGAHDNFPMQSPLFRALRTGSIVELAKQTDLITRDGERRHIADSAAPIQNNSGKIIGAILVFRDVTEECETRDRLKSTVKMLEFASDLTHSAAFSLDLKTRRITGSNQIRELWPVDSNGFAVPIDQWVYGPDRRKMTEIVEQLRAGKQDAAVVDFRAVKDGRIRYYQVKMSANHTPSGGINMLGVIQDITEITVGMRQHQDTVEMWEMAISTLPIMFFVKDADNDFRYLMCNEAFCAFHNLPADRIIGKNDSELLRKCPNEIHRDDLEVADSHEVRHFYYTVEDAHGFPHKLKNVKKCFVQADGKRVIVGASSDISEQQNVIRNENALKEALSRVMLEPTFDGAFARLAAAISGVLDCDRIILSQCNGAGRLRYHSEWHATGMSELDEAQQELHHRAWDAHLERIQQGMLVKFDDFDPAGPEGAFQPEHDGSTAPQSLIIAPIFIENHLWGALSVSFSRFRHAFTASDESLMRSMADIITLSQIRERQQQEIRRVNHEKQMVLDHIHIPIWLHDGNGELLMANAEVQKLAGLGAEELTTEKNFEVFAEDFPADTERPVPAVVRTGREVFLNITYHGRDYMVFAHPVFDKNQKMTHIVKSAIDITELNKSLRCQKLVSFCLETFFAESDMKSAFTLVLRAISRYLGVQRSYVMRFDSAQHAATTLAEFHTKDCPDIWSNVREFPYSCDEPWYKSFERNELISWPDTRNADAAEFFGGWYPVVSQLQSLHVMGIFLNGELWGDIGISFAGADRSLAPLEKSFLRTIGGILELFLERMAAQEKILDALNQAQAAAKAKSFFIASISHEIRTPLNAVIGFAELLRDESLSKTERTEYLEGVVYAGNALLQLINDVLDLSKLEADQMQIITETADFAELGKEMFQVFAARAKENRVELKMQIPQLPPMQLDKLRIRQILFNLIGNAIKFTPSGSVTLKADFQPVDAQTGTLRFSVADTGIGIAPEDRQKLLEPFVQLSKLRGTNAGNNGTGLGLPICKRLIEKMDGTLDADSTPGVGSEFTTVLHHVRYEPSGAESTPSLPTPDAAGKPDDSLAILLVDDVQLNLRVMSALFRKIGVSRIFCAGSGAEALRQLESAPVDLVLTDLWMPEMNGAELVREIHRRPGLSGLPVVAVTADVEIKENFDTEDFADVLFKPLTIEKCRTVLAERLPLRLSQKNKG